VETARHKALDVARIVAAQAAAAAAAGGSDVGSSSSSSSRVRPPVDLIISADTVSGGGGGARRFNHWSGGCSACRCHAHTYHRLTVRIELLTELQPIKEQQIVEHDGYILEKPDDVEHARKMLQR
jgi:hypothetical protein